jgi:hypothetical protein
MKLIRVLVVGDGDTVQLQKVADVRGPGSMVRRIPTLLHGLADQGTLADAVSRELLQDKLLTLDRTIVGKLLLSLPRGAVLAGRSKRRIRADLARAEVLGGGGRAPFKDLLERRLPAIGIGLGIG